MKVVPKRMSREQLRQIAAAEIRSLICRYGERNLNRLTLAIRRQAREQKAQVKA